MRCAAWQPVAVGGVLVLVDVLETGCATRADFVKYVGVAAIASFIAGAFCAVLAKLIGR